MSPAEVDGTDGGRCRRAEAMTIAVATDASCVMAVGVESRENKRKNGFIPLGGTMGRKSTTGHGCPVRTSATMGKLAYRSQVEL